MQLLEQIVDGLDRQRRRRDRILRQHFERRVAAVAVPEIKLAQPGRRDATYGAQGVADQSPAELQHLVLTRWKRMAGEPGCHPGERFLFEPGKILGEQTRLLQLAAHGADGGAGFGEFLKARLRVRRNRPTPDPSRGGERPGVRAPPVPLLGRVRDGFAGGNSYSLRCI